MSATRGSGFTFCQQAYDTISAIYQDSLIPHHQHAQDVLNQLAARKLLKPHSRILEVGCGTGKPITAYFADNGHNVTAIDSSTAMLNLARKNAPKARFLQVDMTTWEPPSSSDSDSTSYDLIMASHCLYTLSISQIRSLIYKFTLWVKQGGIVVIGMSYNRGNLNKENRQFDERGWSEGMTGRFLGYQFEDSSIGREDAWVRLIQSTGLEIVDVDRTMVRRPDEVDPDVQFYIIAKKVQENSSFGPFPVPDTPSVDCPPKFQIDAWVKLSEKLDTVKLEKVILEVLTHQNSTTKCHRVLFVNGQTTTYPFVVEDPDIEIQQISEFPSLATQPGSFDCVVLADGVLYAASSPGDHINYAIQAISSTEHSKIIIIACSPDNELVNMLKDASKGLDIPLLHLHRGRFLKMVELECKSRGFCRLLYLHTQSSLNLGAFEGEESITSTARLLSTGWTDDAAVQAQLEERLKKLIRTQLLFKSEIFSQMVVLIAQRS